MEQVSNLIIQKLKIMTGVPGTDPIFLSRRKAISALLPYAAYLVQDGSQEMFDVILCVASKPPLGGFMWHRVGDSVTSWFHESYPPPLNQAMIFASPYANWGWGSYTENAVSRWAAVVLAAPYSEALAQSVVDTLLQIASKWNLQQHIPIEIWGWLKRRPSLPPVCQGRRWGADETVVYHIWRLGDIEILKSYFLLIWSEWDGLSHSSLCAMEVVIREGFCGIAKWQHRNDLTKHLDHVLGELDRGLKYFQRYDPQTEEREIAGTRGGYRRLKEALAKLDREAMLTLSRTPPNFIHFDENIDDCV